MRNPRVHISIAAWLLGLPGMAVLAGEDAAAQAGGQMQTTTSATARQTLSAAAYYSRGDYGQDVDTSIYYMPLSYEYATSRWRLKATVPWLKIRGYGDVLVNIGGIGRDSQDPFAARRVASSGMGDTLLSLSYQFDALFDGGPFMDLTVETKLPTADEKQGLGTGELDYGIQVDLYQMLGAHTLFTTAGYRWRGRTLLFEGLRDSGFLSLGVMRPWADSWLEQRLGGQWSYGMLYDYREAASDFSGETHELMPFVSWNASAQWTVMPYLLRGFTSDSADIALGVQLSYRW